MKRVLLIVVFVLFIALFLSGLANFFFIKKLDDRYTGILDSNIQTANIMRSIARESILRQRELNNLLLIGTDKESEANRATYCQIIEQATARNKQNIKKLQPLLKDSDTKEKFDEMLLAKNQAAAEFDKVMLLLKEGKSEEAMQHKNDVLRPLFASYLEKQDTLAEKLENTTVKRNESISQLSSFFRWISVGLSTWPVILITLLVLGLLGAAFFIGWNLPDEHH